MTAWTRSAARVLVLFFLAGATPLSMVGCAASAIRLRVENQTGAVITNMKVGYTGGTVTIDRIKAGATYTANFVPTGPSGLEVEFQIAGGETKHDTIRAALERYSVGELVLQIIPGGGVGWTIHLSPGKTPPPEGVMVPRPGNQP